MVTSTIFQVSMWLLATSSMWLLAMFISFSYVGPAIDFYELAGKIVLILLRS